MSNVLNTYRASFFFIVAFSALVCATAAQEGEPVSRYQCQHNMEALGEVLVSFAKVHENRFPTALHELVPDYQKKLKVCPYDPSGQSQIKYTVSVDRRFFGLYCSFDHSFRQRGAYEPAMVIGKLPVEGQEFLRNLKGVTGKLGDGYVEACEAAIAKKAKSLEKYYKDPKDYPELPYTESSLKYDFCNSSHEITFRPDGSYQIICTSLDHADEGLQPLQPRYDSLTGEFTHSSLKDEQPEQWYSWVLNPVFPSTVILITLTLIRIRRRLWPQNRTLPQRSSL